MYPFRSASGLSFPPPGQYGGGGGLYPSSFFAPQPSYPSYPSYGPAPGHGGYHHGAGHHPHQHHLAHGGHVAGPGHHGAVFRTLSSSSAPSAPFPHYSLRTTSSPDRTEHSFYNHNVTGPLNQSQFRSAASPVQEDRSVRHTLLPEMSPRYKQYFFFFFFC
jgi:hypothetical protein